MSNFNRPYLFPLMSRYFWWSIFEVKPHTQVLRLHLIESLVNWNSKVRKGNSPKHPGSGTVVNWNVTGGGRVTRNLNSHLPFLFPFLSLSSLLVRSCYFRPHPSLSILSFFDSPSPLLLELFSRETPIVHSERSQKNPRRPRGLVNITISCLTF